MGMHSLGNDLEYAHLPSGINRMFNTPEGWCFGCGTTPVASEAGWAPGAIFVDTDASSGNLLMNTGTKASATWTDFTNPS